MNILVPLGGSIQAFKDRGFFYPKNLTEVKGKPLIQHVYENLRNVNDAKFIFVFKREEATSYHLDDVLTLLEPSCTCYITDGETSGAACTALLAIESINTEEPLIIANGDQIILGDLQVIIDSFTERDLDGGIVTFNSVHPRWSYVKVDEENIVIETAEKHPISHHATAGIYYFKRGSDFVQAAMETIRKDAQTDEKFYICPTYNELILRHKKIGIYEIKRDQYKSLSNPQDIEEYEKYIEGLVK